MNLPACSIYLTISPQCPACSFVCCLGLLFTICFPKQQVGHPVPTRLNNGHADSSVAKRLPFVESRRGTLQAVNVRSSRGQSNGGGGGGDSGGGSEGPTTAVPDAAWLVTPPASGDFLVRIEMGGQRWWRWVQVDMEPPMAYGSMEAVTNADSSGGLGGSGTGPTEPGATAGGVSVAALRFLVARVYFSEPVAAFDMAAAARMGGGAGLADVQCGGANGAPAAVGVYEWCTAVLYGEDGSTPSLTLPAGSFADLNGNANVA